MENINGEKYTFVHTVFLIAFETVISTIIRVAYIMYCLLFSKSLDCPGLWLCIKRIQDQKFVNKTIFYVEQLLFQIFTN